MKTTINRARLRALMAQPPFSPTDCPNFITYKDYGHYCWYARVLLPLLLVTRGGPLFVGHRKATLLGESPGETWMVVRYPSHRRMLLMVMNPYYALVANRFRERGTARLELGFTRPLDPHSGLQRHSLVLGIHVRPADAGAFFTALRALVEKAGLVTAYESELRLSLDFIENPRPNDPNPLTYPVTVAVAGATETALRAFAADAALAGLLKAQPAACVQLYERAGPYDYIRLGKGPLRQSG